MKVSIANAVVVLLGTQAVYADIYLQGCFPGRGSNNRLDEANRDRNNGNRLFNSQNNNRGGVNVGVMEVCAGSRVPIEYVNQHGAKVSDRNVEIVAQYMVSKQNKLMRDGTTTKTIPEKQTDCRNKNCETDVKYGMHEDYTYYTKCKYRERNIGLFTADQKLRRDDARYTRQSPKGTRYGYECPEERDYYPYWAPTPWIDAFMMTDNTKKCEGYIALSENNVGRGWCKISQRAINNIVNMTNETVPEITARRRGNVDFAETRVPNNKVGCEDLEVKFLEEMAEDKANGEDDKVPMQAEWVVEKSWKEIDSSIPDLECLPTSRSRLNHLGNTHGSIEYSNVEWVIPKNLAGETVVFRMRYNITTLDFAQHTDVARADGVDYRNNTRLDENMMNTDTYSRFDLTMEEAMDRKYYHRKNPNVDALKKPDGGDFPGPFAGYGAPDSDSLTFQLAVNTAQWGRTFQDRTHTFKVIDCGEDGSDVFHMCVRGKRGNIVQTFPSTEYDFSPPLLKVQTDQRVKIVMAGSNTNPNNNDGQGKQGTDRSNIVPLREIMPSAKPYFRGSVAGRGRVEMNREEATTCGTGTHLARSYPTTDAFKSHDNYEPFMGLSKEEIRALATSAIQNDHEQLGGENSELDDWSTEFRSFVRAKAAGCWSFLSTRNNNFSNRSQKSDIQVVKKGQMMWSGSEETYTTGELPRTLQLGKMSISIGAAEDNSMQRTIVLTPQQIDNGNPKCLYKLNGCDKWHVALKKIEFDDLLTKEEDIVKTVDVWGGIPYQFGVMNVDVKFCPDNMDCEEVESWDTLSNQFTSIGLQDVKVNMKQSGTYVVSYGVNVAVIVGSVVGGLALVGLVAGVVIFFRKNPSKWASVTTKLSSIKRAHQRYL